MVLITYKINHIKNQWNYSTTSISHKNWCNPRQIIKKNEICCIYLNFLSSERVLIKISMVCVETLKKNYQKCQEFGIQKVTNRTQWCFRQCVGGSMVTSTTQEAGTTWAATTRRHSSVKQWEVYMIHHKFCLLIIRSSWSYIFVWHTVKVVIYVLGEFTLVMW